MGILTRKKKEMTIREFSSKGGKTTLQKYGPKHYGDISKKAREKLKESGFFKEFSKKGIAARKKNKERKINEETAPVNKVARLLSGEM